jgi:hypothetical protein
MPACAFEISGSDCILPGLLIMLAAVELDYEFARMAREVDDIGTDRLLPDELISAKAPPAKVVP